MRALLSQGGILQVKRLNVMRPQLVFLHSDCPVSKAIDGDIRLRGFHTARSQQSYKLGGLRADPYFYRSITQDCAVGDDMLRGLPARVLRLKPGCYVQLCCASAAEACAQVHDPSPARCRPFPCCLSLIYPTRLSLHAHTLPNQCIAFPCLDASTRQYIGAITGSLCATCSVDGHEPQGKENFKV